MGADFIATGIWRRGSVQITEAEAAAVREEIRSLTPKTIARRLPMLWEAYEDDPYGMLDLDANVDFDPVTESETIADAIRKMLEGDFEWLYETALKGGDRGVTTMLVGPYEVLVMGEMSWGDLGDEQVGLGRLADSGVLDSIGFFRHGYPDVGDVVSACIDALVDRYTDEGYDEAEMRQRILDGWRAAGDEGAIWFSTLGPFLDSLAETVGIAPFPPEPFQPDHTQEEVPTP